VHLSTSPNYHTAVTTFAGNSLHMGHTVVCMDKWDAEETLRLIQTYKCSHTHMVPTQFIRMLQLPDDVKSRYDVSSMKWAIHAAAPCPVDVKRKMLDWWGPVIWEYYAATEGGGTIAPPDEWLKYPGTVGRVWPIAELKITDDDGNRLPAGEGGTVWMKMGAGDFEYKGDQAKTDSSHDAEGYFTVGDIGYLNAASGVGNLLAPALYLLLSRRLAPRRLLAVAVAAGAIGTAISLFYDSYGAALVIHVAGGVLFNVSFLAIMELAVWATPSGAAAMGFALLMSAWNIGGSAGDILGAQVAHGWSLGFYHLAALYAVFSLLPLCAIRLLPRAMFERDQ